MELPLTMFVIVLVAYIAYLVTVGLFSSLDDISLLLGWAFASLALGTVCRLLLNHRFTEGVILIQPIVFKYVPLMAAAVGVYALVMGYVQ